MVAAAVFYLSVTLTGEAALAFSARDYPSFTLKVFGHDAVIFYRPSITQGGLSTSIVIDGRSENGVNPSTAAEIQKRIDKAQEVQLIYTPGSIGSTAVDLLSRIPSSKPWGLSIFVQPQRTPVTAEISPKILSAIEQLSDDPDASHFDEYGYRLLPQPVPNLVMQRSRYSRPNGRPFFLLRQELSRTEPAYAYVGYFIYGTNVHVLYRFSNVSREHWVDVDKAALEFIATVLGPTKKQP